MQRLFKYLIVSIIIFTPFVQHAQIDNSFDLEYISGRVVDVVQDENGRTLYKTQLKSGESILLDSYGESLFPGVRVYVEHFVEDNIYNFVTIDRTSIIMWILGLFIVFILLMSRKKGFRSLLSLGVSFLLLIFGLVPLLMHGHDPVLVSMIFGLCVLFLGIFVTHGFNRQSLVSFLGSTVSIIIAFLLLSIVSKTSFLTGIVNEHTQFLSFETGAVVDFVRLFMAAVIIGTLGVLDDITITQVAVVRELSDDERLTRSDIFRKALMVGRDHISSLVNTLIFAYVGATLPLIMFISLLDIPFLVLISQEFIFVEIIRSLVGAIALIIAVPLTTWFAVYIFLDSLHRDEKKITSACAHCHN